MKQITSFMTKFHAAILVIDDDVDILTTARVVLRQKFQTVTTESNPEKIRTLLTQSKYDVILLDMNYKAGVTSGNEGLYWLKKIIAEHKDQQVIMMTAYGDISLAVEAMKHGAADFIVKPWQNEKLEATVTAAFNHAQARKEIGQLKKQQSHYTRALSGPDSEFICHSPAMRELWKTIEKVSATDANILLLGENGTGKELIARQIHFLSLRKDQPFIKVDLGSLSESLFESELFGHKKGSFTDAREERIGRFEIANNGTLFLDEIGNLPSPLQSKLLSALQNREITPLGSNMSLPVNIRLISATNIDIHQAVQDEMFREDLLYRINTVELLIPPLRERKEDIQPLAEHFIQVYASKYRKEQILLESESLTALKNYDWPGNVRELQHAIERAIIMSDGSKLRRGDFLLTPRKEGKNKKEVINLEEMERMAIEGAIQKYGGNMSKVAKELGLGRTTLYRKISKYGLDK
jgi:two-component system, NtrC family, response regulator HydG